MLSDTFLTASETTVHSLAVRIHMQYGTPLFYNGITEGECDTLSGTHFKNPQAIYSGTRIKKVGLEIWPFLLEAKRTSAEARTLEF